MSDKPASEVAKEQAARAKDAVRTVRDKANTVAAEAGKKYEEISAEVRKGASRAAETAKQRYDEAAETVKQRYEETAETVKQRVDDATESVKAGYGRVRRDVSGAATNLETYVRDNPTQSVAIALGAGFILGLLLRPRGRD